MEYEHATHYLNMLNYLWWLGWQFREHYDQKIMAEEWPCVATMSYANIPPSSRYICINVKVLDPLMRDDWNNCSCTALGTVCFHFCFLLCL